MKLSKFFTGILAFVIVFACGVTNVSAAETLKYDSDILTDAIETNESFIEIGESYNYSPRTRGTINVGTTFYKTDTLTSSDAIDFYPFTISNARSAVFGFTSTNANYSANLAIYDTSTGDVSLTNIWLDPDDLLWMSNLPSGNYCWVVLSLNNTYSTGKYTLGMNAGNRTGASSLISVSSTYSRATFRYSNDTIRSNDMDVSTQVSNYISTQMSGTVFRDKYESGSPSYKVANVGVVSGADYISGPLYYGSYTSTNPHTNPHTGLGHSSSDVVFIPINGYSFICTISGTYIPYQHLSDLATGFLVYDLVSGKVIDWMSSSNLFYTSPGYFTYKNSYNIYAEL